MERFVLRPYRWSDVDEVFDAADESREHVGRWMGWMTPTYSRDDARRWVEHAVQAWGSGECYEFLIIDSQEGTIAGSCGLNCLNRKDMFCNLGYWVRRSRLGQGAAKQAVLAARDFGHGELGMNRLEIVVAEGNTHSRRVAESVHALYEGLLRMRLVVGSRPHDAHMYALLRNDMAGH